MSDLPQGWAETCIQDIAEVNPGRLGDIAVDAQISFVPMPAVSDIDGEIVDPTIRSYGEVSKGYTQFREGDVIFAKITPCMENGKIAVARALEGGMACGSTEFHVVRPSGGISSDFLWRYLRQKSFRNDAEASMTGAVGQRRVPAIFLKEHSVALPPLPEQRRIVAKLDSLTGKSRRARDHLDHIPRLVEKYKQAILAAAFRGDLTREWREARGLPTPRSVLLGDVAEGFNYGSAAKSAKEGRVPVLRMGNIQDGKLDWADLVFTDDAAEIAKYALKEGDVLFNRTNSPALVGKTALFSGEREAIYAGYLIKVRCKSELLPAFLTYCINAPNGRAYSWEVKTDGVSQSNINAKKLAAFRFDLPSTEEQAEIVRCIEAALSWINRITIDATSARKLIDRLDQSVLAKAFKGELIPQDPTDEPAAALLERIRAERAAAPKTKRGRKKAA
jgi:type I restriction enzyme S subunit